MLHARIRKKAIYETRFYAKAERYRDVLTYRLFDIDVETLRQKKWLHQFDTVKAVVYVVSISDYDVPLPDNESRVSVTP
jgi:hypothetical protein